MVLKLAIDAKKETILVKSRVSTMMIKCLEGEQGLVISRGYCRRCVCLADRKWWSAL